MRAGPLFALTIAVVGCGGGTDRPVDSAQLNRIAIQRNEMDDVGRTARLQPLSGSVAGANGQGLHCLFSDNGRPLVALAGEWATARIDGSDRRFRAAGAVEPTGGFFRADELSLSIGAVPGGLARARVTNRLTLAREEALGSWTCMAAGG